MLSQQRLPVPAQDEKIPVRESAGFHVSAKYDWMDIVRLAVDYMSAVGQKCAFNY
jgi:hypothetical protein